jgi:hypothetical protein
MVFPQYDGQEPEKFVSGAGFANPQTGKNFMLMAKYVNPYRN